MSCNLFCHFGFGIKIRNNKWFSGFWILIWFGHIEKIMIWSTGLDAILLKGIHLFIPVWRDDEETSPAASRGAAAVMSCHSNYKLANGNAPLEILPTCKKCFATKLIPKQIEAATWTQVPYKIYKFTKS